MKTICCGLSAVNLAHSLLDVVVQRRPTPVGAGAEPRHAPFVTTGRSIRPTWDAPTCQSRASCFVGDSRNSATPPRAVSSGVCAPVSRLIRNVPYRTEGPFSPIIATEGYLSIIDLSWREVAQQARVDRPCGRNNRLGGW